MPGAGWQPLPLFLDRRLALAVLDGLPREGTDDMAGCSDARLFYRLRDRLRELDEVVDLTGPDVDAWDALGHGLMVELAGEIARNPVVELLEFVVRLFPVAQEVGEQPTRRARGRRGSASGPEGEASLALFRLVTEDVQTARTQDALFHLAGTSITCLLTLPREVGEGRTIDDLLGMRLRVLGKVVRLLSPDDAVSLVRRSTLGSAAGDLLRAGIVEIAQVADVPLPPSEVDVRGPSLFVLPIAIFV